MKLNYDRNSKDPTYFVQLGVRNGKKTTTKNVARIGKHSELLKITDDPLAYAKEQVKKYNEDYKKDNKVSLDLKLNFAEKIKSTDSISSKSTTSNIGYLFLQQIYHELRLDSFFKEIIQDSKITFNPNEINRFLTFSRILEPDSKLGTYDHIDKFYEKPDFNYVHILRTMDLLYNNYSQYISHLFEHSNSIVKRDTSVCYYDCTNYYFEIETEDEDYIDEVTHESIKGFRKYGPSKEHKPNPLVEMGLFMDSDGIPLSMCITSGSTNEQTTAIPLESKLSQMFENKPFIYCADGGLGSLNIRLFNSMKDRAFIVTQSVKKLSEPLKQAVFCDCDYKLLSSDETFSLEQMKSFDRFNKDFSKLYNDCIYKVLTADKAVDVGLYEEKILKNGKRKKIKSPATLKQQIIITFSRKMMEYQRTIRNRQIERARALLKNLDPTTFKKGPNDVTRFIKASSKEKNQYILDEDRIKEEEKYDGFYAIATNLEDDAKDIIEISSRRYKIEECFRVLKTNFEARPVFHRKKERIISHFMICYTALLIYRLLEKKLSTNGYHFSIDNIIETIKNMEVTNIEDVCYAATYTSSQVCTALNATFDLGLDKRYYQPKELSKKIKKISN